MEDSRAMMSYRLKKQDVLEYKKMPEDLILASRASLMVCHLILSIQCQLLTSSFLTKDVERHFCCY